MLGEVHCRDHIEHHILDHLIHSKKAGIPFLKLDIENQWRARESLLYINDTSSTFVHGHGIIQNLYKSHRLVNLSFQLLTKPRPINPSSLALPSPSNPVMVISVVKLLLNRADTESTQTLHLYSKGSNFTKYKNLKFQTKEHNLKKIHAWWSARHYYQTRSEKIFPKSKTRGLAIEDSS